MKNAKLKILLCLLIIVISIISIYLKFSKNENQTNSETQKNETSTSNVIIGFNTTNIKQNPINVNGENSSIYIGTGTSNYNLFSIYIDKEKSKEEQGLEIIQNIAQKIGYNIQIHSLTIEDNKIKVDFDSNYAPITIEGNYNGNYEEIYVTYSDSAVVHSSFDSIYKSFKDYFGQNYEIYFSANNQNISLPDIDNGFSIDMNILYEPAEE